MFNWKESYDPRNLWEISLKEKDYLVQILDCSFAISVN